MNNEAMLDFSYMSSFIPKSLWKPPKEHLKFEVFLNEVEKGIFITANSTLGYSDFLREE